MRKKTLLLTAMTACAMLSATAQPQPQGMGRRQMWASVNALSNASTGDYTQQNNKLLISWRMLPSDDWDTSFLLYCGSATAENPSTYSRVSPSPIKNATCYQTSIRSTATKYFLLPGDFPYASKTLLISAEERQAMRDAAIDSLVVDERIYKDKLPYLSIPLQDTKDVYAGDDLEYQANDVSVGDLDGDGEFEIVVKRLQSPKGHLDGGTGASYSSHNTIYAVIWDAYKLDGTLLWRIKGGPGIILGNSSAFAIADFDGDGCAEMAIRTCEGTVFGDGQEIPDTNGDGKIDYRTWGNENSSSPGWVDHYNSAGPEFISIIDGKTGRELARDNFIARETSESWGDGYWKRACSFRVGVACFDNLPSVVFGRGVYARSVLEAWDYRDGKLTRRWRFDSAKAGGSTTNKDGKPNSAYGGQGNHSFNTADLDGDGKDEVMYGSMAIDDDGYGLWSTQLGHGDANHVGRFLPDREGLQVYHCLESGKTMVALHDAKDGKVIWKKEGSSDNDTGRCLVADIDPNSPGCEFWWAGSNAYSQDGSRDLGYSPSSCNMAIWFDGKLSRQLINAPSGGGGTISNDRDGGRVFTVYRYSSHFINGTKANPSWYGDFLGDWREEFIVPDNTLVGDLKIFSTWYPTDYKFPWLMTDHTYWMQTLNQNIGYNQPNHIGGYYLGNGMDMSKVPVGVTTGIRDVQTATQQGPRADQRIYDLSGRVVQNPGHGIYVQGGKKVVF
ncbi:MAG: hypothetical protein IJ841_02330 [Prevotella sp.]|nr:hypothetical protein [Prevotella sp.]